MSLNSVNTPSVSSNLKLAVQKAEALLIDDNSILFPLDVPKSIYFMQGNGVEITQRLQQLSGSITQKSKKYPLVWLNRDFKETLIASKGGFYIKCRPKIFIISLTSINYTTDQREEKNFEAILRPVFNKLIESIVSMPTFGKVPITKLNIEKVDRMFWGSNQVEHKTNDPVDCIEFDIDLEVHLEKGECVGNKII
jgi:hypothetical protein